MPAKVLKRTHFPSITGSAASGPMFPNPRTAEPSVTTATRFPLVVYSQTLSGSLTISSTGAATPGLEMIKSVCSSFTGILLWISIAPR